MVYSVMVLYLCRFCVFCLFVSSFLIRLFLASNSSLQCYVKRECVSNDSRYTFSNIMSIVDVMSCGAQFGASSVKKRYSEVFAVQFDGQTVWNCIFFQPNCQFVFDLQIKQSMHRLAFTPHSSESHNVTELCNFAWICARAIDSEHHSNRKFTYIYGQQFMSLLMDFYWFVSFSLSIDLTSNNLNTFFFFTSAIDFGVHFHTCIRVSELALCLSVNCNYRLIKLSMLVIRLSVFSLHLIHSFLYNICVGFLFILCVLHSNLLYSQEDIVIDKNDCFLLN